MAVATQDPAQLIECLHRLMGATESDEVMNGAAGYADMLETVPS